MSLTVCSSMPGSKRRASAARRESRSWHASSRPWPCRWWASSVVVDRIIGPSPLTRQFATELAGDVAAVDAVEVEVAVAGRADKAADELAASGHQLLHVGFHRPGDDH